MDKRQQRAHLPGGQPRPSRLLTAGGAQVLMLLEWPKIGLQFAKGENTAAPSFRTGASVPGGLYWEGRLLMQSRVFRKML